MSDAAPDRQPSPIPSTSQILDAMRRAAAEELERKRRLSQYAVHWENGRVVLRGEDAPRPADGGLVIAEPGAPDPHGKAGVQG